MRWVLPSPKPEAVLLRKGARRGLSSRGKVGSGTGTAGPACCRPQGRGAGSEGPGTPPSCHHGVGVGGISLGQTQAVLLPTPGWATVTAAPQAARCPDSLLCMAQHSLMAARTHCPGQRGGSVSAAGQAGT